MFIFQTFFCVAFLVCVASSGKHGQYSRQLWNLIVSEQKGGRVVGSFVKLFPISVKFYNGDLSVTIDKEILQNKASDVDKDITVFGGKGVQIRPSKYPIIIDIRPPNTQSNICGLIIGNSNPTNSIKRIQILWKSKPNGEWDLLSVPSTGEYFFTLSGSINSEKRVVLFDPVPASKIRVLVHATDGAGLTISAALIHGCQYPDTIKLSCNDIFEKNDKLTGMIDGVPRSVSCPKGCRRTKECIGYKAYSTTSQICYVAQQALGLSGDGNYFLYNIPNVVFFRDQLNPILNNGIYCKKSVKVHRGMTFNRVYYDFAVKEFQRQKKI